MSEIYWIAARVLAVVNLLVAWRGISFGLRCGSRSMVRCSAVFLMVGFIAAILLVVLG